MGVWLAVVLEEGGVTPYELPPAESPQVNQEYEFLMTARTVEREIRRLVLMGTKF